jgi:hypothetical protein
MSLLLYSLVAAAKVRTRKFLLERWIWIPRLRGNDGEHINPFVFFKARVH